jgi:pimeloyl-ACP methyl ester carboxylesterase
MLKSIQRKPDRVLLSEKVLEEHPKFAHEEALKKKMLANPAQRDQFLKLLWSGMGFPPRMYVDGWLNDIRLYKDSLDLSQASQIKTPTMFVHGVYDVNARFDAAKDLAARIEGAEFFEFDGGHFGMITHEKIITPAVLEFLARHAPEPISN